MPALTSFSAAHIRKEIDSNPAGRLPGEKSHFSGRASIDHPSRICIYIRYLSQCPLSPAAPPLYTTRVAQATSNDGCNIHQQKVVSTSIDGCIVHQQKVVSHLLHDLCASIVFSAHGAFELAWRFGLRGKNSAGQSSSIRIDPALTDCMHI